MLFYFKFDLVNSPQTNYPKLKKIFRNCTKFNYLYNIDTRLLLYYLNQRASRLDF